jgi:hypothetical protein
MTALMPPRIETYLSVLVLLLAIVASAAGLLHPALYRDSRVMLPQSFGQDLVTLVFGAPLLAAGIALNARGSLRGRLAWLGALGYVLYTYATYAFGARWNELFLVYVALFGLSLFTFAAGLARTDATAVRARFAPGAPRRSVAVFLIAVAAAVGLMWLSENVTAIASGEPPRSAVEAEIPTNFIHVADLGVVLPAAALAGTLLLRSAPFGFVLAGVLLVKIATLGLAVVAMGVFMQRQGIPVPPVQFVVFGGLTAVAIGLGGLFLRARSPGVRAART